jgi:hypothetical protein
MIPQTPHRTHKEALQDMGCKLSDLDGLTALLVSEIEALALATLPDGRERAKLLAACNAKLVDEPARVLAGDASPVALAIQEILVTAAEMLRGLEELKALRREPFKATA